ncbi:MAG: phage tail protein [Gammaproteobacteria bacterium]|nr:phage tail protein [Gammaproteobacteria bacterium]
MSQPCIGEIRMFGGNFAPTGWMFCAGQLLSISENETLFQLIGTTYGGDGQTTFGVHDLRGRVPVHIGPGFSFAEFGGEETIRLTTAQVPSHTHAWLASTALASGTAPSGSLTATTSGAPLYVADPLSTALAQGSLSATGGGQPHENMMPYLCVSFIISLFGIFPTPS